MAAPTATALVLRAPGTLVTERFPLPPAGDDDALLRVEACGLCGSDHEVFTGRMRWPMGFIPGHETVGVVERIGPGAGERWGIDAGDRVAVGNRRACRECGPCRVGKLADCERFGPMVSYGMVPVSEPPSLWGGYATHHHLAPESVVHRVPDGLDPVTATLFNPLAAGFAWAVRAPATRPGEVVAVLGCGIRGLCAAAAAKSAGARFVMVTGHGERDAPRLAAAAEFGADLTVDVAAADPVAELQRAAGTLADVVVDVTADAPDAFGQAMEVARMRARIVCAGIRGDGVTAVCQPDLVVRRELRLLGVRGVPAAEIAPALDLLAQRRFPFDALPRAVAGFDGVAALLDRMAGRASQPPPLHAVFTATGAY
ncbi:zinc-dependent alcohol dehydrogenase [Streptomyces spiralis]|uniref:zinc-dependent alcohol dehydrogenase n=1 Tax=Streptomyces spiralis TaxID=66376 RepID=UPI0033E408A5